MNKEAKVGDYIRTKTGIHKVFEIRENAPMNRYMCDKKLTGEWDGSYEFNLIRVDDIINVSSNIIDLIEVEDYVNGYLVYEIKENCVLVGYKCFKTEFDNEEDLLYQTIYANDIKSIVTKEQFEKMEYKVGD